MTVPDMNDRTFIIIVVTGLFAAIVVPVLYALSYEENLDPKKGWVRAGQHYKRCDGDDMVYQNSSGLSVRQNHPECK